METCSYALWKSRNATAIAKWIRRFFIANYRSEIKKERNKQKTKQKTNKQRQNKTEQNKKPENIAIAIAKCFRPQRSKFWLSVRPRQPKKSPDNQKYWCSCSTDNHYSVAKIKLYMYILTVPSTDNQKRGWTTRNCNLVVRGSTIYFLFNSTTSGVLYCMSEMKPGNYRYCEMWTLCHYGTP